MDPELFAIDVAFGWHWKKVGNDYLSNPLPVEVATTVAKQSRSEGLANLEVKRLTGDPYGTTRLLLTERNIAWLKVKADEIPLNGGKILVKAIENWDNAQAAAAAANNRPGREL